MSEINRLGYHIAYSFLREIKALQRERAKANKIWRDGRWHNTVVVSALEKRLWQLAAHCEYVRQHSSDAYENAVRSMHMRETDAPETIMNMAWEDYGARVLTKKGFRDVYGGERWVDSNDDDEDYDYDYDDEQRYDLENGRYYGEDDTRSSTVL